MEVKVLTFVFFIALLQGCVFSDVSNDTSTNETGELRETVCDCGSHGKCSLLVDGSKNCHCDWGFAELDGNCEVCNCGSPQHSCLFKRGLKECACADGYYEEKGQCEAVPMLDWKVREKGAYYIIFRYFPRNVTEDFGSYVIVETTLRNVNLEKQPKISYYTHVRDQAEDVTIVLNGPGTYEFRCRYYGNLGNSSWTDYYRWHWNDASNFTGAPEIVHPRNNSVVTPGRIFTEWRAPPNADQEVTNYKVVLWKRVSINTWTTVGGEPVVDHVVKRRYYNRTFNDYDPAAFYKLSITARGPGYESNVSAPVFFKAGIGDGGLIPRTWLLLGVTVLGSVLGIVLLSLCIYCCVKRRKQTV